MTTKNPYQLSINLSQLSDIINSLWGSLSVCNNLFIVVDVFNKVYLDFVSSSGNPYRKIQWSQFAHLEGGNSNATNEQKFV
jgi:hypothetical protein